MARKPGRSTIGNSPISNKALDAVIPGKRSPEKADLPAAGKERVTMYLPIALAERLRDAAWWTRSTLAAIAEEAFTEKMAKLEKEHGPIKKRQADLKIGRPIKQVS